MEIEIRHLRIIEAVAAHGSFRRAAQHLGVSQPTLSRQISRLERHLGAQLFVRDPDGARVTDAGAIALRHSRRTMTAIADLVRELRELSGDDHTPIRLVASLNPAVTVRHMTRAGHRLDVRVIPDDQAALALFDRGAADVVMVIDDPERSYTPAFGVELMVIMSTPLWVCMPATSGFTDSEDVDLAGLAGEPWLLPQTGTIRTLIERACSSRGFSPHSVLTGDVDLMMSAMEAEVGVGLYGPLCGLYFGKDYTVRPLRDGLLETKIIAWRPDRVSSSMVRDIVRAQQNTHLTLAANLPQYAEWLTANPESVPLVA